MLKAEDNRFICLPSNALSVEVVGLFVGSTFIHICHISPLKPSCFTIMACYAKHSLAHNPKVHAKISVLVVKGVCQ